MTAITDWLTVVFTATSAATPFLLYRLRASANLPLIEAEAVRVRKYETKNAVKVILKFSNKINETLSVTDIRCRKISKFLITPVLYREDKSGRIEDTLSSDWFVSFDFPHKISKSEHISGPLRGEARRIEFYVSPVSPISTGIKISLRISSSARTLKRRRLVIPIKITDEAANAPA
ncbi:hypothetical protein K2X14_11645 [Acetobacter sp. TBRC 12305]|uniref:Uncharacterized protein n=1 Tax=Acetobacter garciniae TaxID=2817435 RepID=A0A939HQ47_9PROT|nr:hypothetical protein [Acetobacter garciniae]MBO1325336.1 hypothetical protein [Acetobacter garciniae]MBX0345492.1 hypothetical protein [Acetobacter garciniae]